ncbi:mitochondrial enolase superfamily member 1 [Grus japonensis]|uniref:Mitochondrial enolase superfamily member 1 n=1 Tax=Grus japonensis TaxID=30415 RepID=A0ABC9Y0P4_GRUJA
MLLDLVLTNKEGLVEDLKVGGSLGCSDHEMVEFRILHGRNRAISRITTLDFRRANFGLLKDLPGRIAWDRALEDRGVQDSWSIFKHHFLQAQDWPWRTGEVPEDWRKASVTPVFQKGKKEDPGDYRPVSLTSIPGMVMERLILGVINKHVEKKKVIGSAQHGFTMGKSCLTNLIAFCDGMTGWMDEGRAVNVVYLDFSRAFDTLCHNILTGKLRKCGLD